MHRLAWDCGYAVPRLMLEQITSQEYDKLMSVLAVSPPPDVRADLRAGRQAWATLQPHSKKRLKERDYVLKITAPHAARRPDAAAFRQKSMQVMGMIVAAFDRKEKLSGKND